MNTKTIKLSTITSLLLLIFSASIFAQQEEKKNNISEIRKNNYQVELGFRSIKSIYENTSSATILFKKKFNPGKLIDVNAVRFMRAYFSVNTQVNFTEDPTRLPLDTTVIRFHPSNINDITFGIGLEKQFQNKSFVHYVGCDLFTQYYTSDDDVPVNSRLGNVALNIPETTDRFYRLISPGLLPFAGFKYYFNDQFSVGVETGIQFSYFNTKITEVRYEEEFVDGENITTFEEKDPVVSNGFKVDFLGLRFVTLGYSFK